MILSPRGARERCHENSDHGLRARCVSLEGWGSPAPAALSRRMPLLPGGQPGAAVPLLPKKPGLLVPQPAHAAGGTGLSRAARAGGGVSLALRKIPVSAQHRSRRGADGLAGNGRTLLCRPGGGLSTFHEAAPFRAVASVCRGRGERSLPAERARPDPPPCLLSEKSLLRGGFLAGGRGAPVRRGGRKFADGRVSGPARAAPHPGDPASAGAARSAVRLPGRGQRPDQHPGRADEAVPSRRRAGMESAGVGPMHGALLSGRDGAGLGRALRPGLPAEPAPPMEKPHSLSGHRRSGLFSARGA